MNIEDIEAQIKNSFETGEINNTAMVQIIELCGLYLNLKTISDYAKEKGMSYNGVKKHRNIVKLFNVKLVIDNE